MTDKEATYPKIKLSLLMREVLELKVLAMFPKEYNCRNDLYNRLTKLESVLVELKNVNVELERDWYD